MKVKDIVRAAGGTTTDMPQVPIALLQANPDNIRLDTQELRDHIRSIADSIKETGYLRSRPLTVRFIGETAMVVDGNCRFAACQIAIAEGAELLTIPCVLEAPGTSAVERVANMVIANSGLQHSALEKVTAIKLMLSYGWTEVKISQRLGVSRQTINNLLDLAGAGADVQQMIAGGTISATQAIKLIRSEGDKAGEAIKAAAEKLPQGKTRLTAKAFKAVEPTVAFEPDGQFDDATDDATHAVITAYAYLALPEGDARSDLMVRINDALSVIMREFVV